jgi:hypothetical protein
MTTAVDQPALNEQASELCTAFGLALSIDPRVRILGLARGRVGGVAQAPTRVRLDGRELARRWRVLGGAPTRTRELRVGGEVVLSVDLAEGAGYLLWARDHGRVLVSTDGMELLCEADPLNAEWASILAAQALPLAATIRGLEVLHAAGVVIDGGALLIAGPPGAGKSSLAAALVADGGALLSDDAVALALTEGGLLAHSGSVVLQLRAAENRRLSSRRLAALGDMLDSSTDRHRYLGASIPGPAPLAAVLLLERSREEPPIEPMLAVSPFALIASTFNLSVRTPARLQRQLDIVAAIAERGLAYRLRVQPKVDATELAQIIREYFRRPLEL